MRNIITINSILATTISGQGRAIVAVAKRITTLRRHCACTAHGLFALAGYRLAIAIPRLRAGQSLGAQMCWQPMPALSRRNSDRLLPSVEVAPGVVGIG